MFRRIIFFILVGAMTAGSLVAQSSSIKVPTPRTKASDGKEMYVTYCATCHGTDGRGNGPMASAFKVPPADLSLLSKKNNGNYPGFHVSSVLKFGIETSSPGAKGMPHWAPALASLDGREGQQASLDLRITNLVDYVRTLQTK